MLQKADPVILKRLDKRIMECESGRILSREPRAFVVTNLGEKVNSPSEEYAPVLTEDERLLIFTSRRPAGNLSAQKDAEGNYFEDIFYSNKEQETWTAAQNIGRPVNSPFHDSDLALSADGTQLYLYTDENAGDILKSEFTKGKWSPPLPMPPPINSPYHESSMSVSSDGRRMFIASDRTGGRGGSDIYLIEKNEAGRWMQPQNLGPTVNTEWDEDSPFIDSDGHTLYFSSTGHNSIGGFDIFRTKENNAQWSQAENLGVPINTPGHDSYFVSTRDGKRAYFSSVREGGYGKEDIYLINLPKELIRVEASSGVLERSADPMARVPAEDILGKVYFAFGSDRLTQTSIDKLDSLSHEIRKFSSLTVSIDGHTDNVGSERFNQALSQARAQSVKLYLQSKGIDSHRMIIRGWGTQKPVIFGGDEKKDHSQNRRVEIRVIHN